MIPHPEDVRPFLEPEHLAVASLAGAHARELISTPEPVDDSAARIKARHLALGFAEAGLYEPIEEMDVRASCLTREALAWASPLADAVWALQALGTTPILAAGTPAQRARWARPALDGRVLMAFAMTEPEAGTDVGSLRTRADRDGDGWLLTGEKWLISNAGIADVYVVFATVEPGTGSAGITAFLVPSDAEGLEFVGPQVLSAPHPLGHVALKECRVEGDALLGEERGGFGLGMSTLDRLRPTVGAAACGMARRALDEAIAFARERRQFGKPIGDFQIIREKVGRMATELDAARLLVYRAAWVVDTEERTPTVDSAMAKAHATETAQRVVDEAVQIIGGLGVLREHPVDRLYRAVRALRIYEGTTEIQRLIVARALLKGERPE